MRHERSIFSPTYCFHSKHDCMIFCGLQEETRNIFHLNPSKGKKIFITKKNKHKTHNREKHHLRCKQSKSILRFWLQSTWNLLKTNMFLYVTLKEIIYKISYFLVAYMLSLICKCLKTSQTLVNTQACCCLEWHATVIISNTGSSKTLGSNYYILTTKRESLWILE